MIGLKNIKSAGLIKNTLMLYILTFSNYFFGLITVPYQTRILGPEIFGKIGFAAAFAMYFQLLLDFGFLLCATAKVAENRDDKVKLSQIMSAVAFIKLIMILLSCIVLTCLCVLVPRIAEDIQLYVLFFIFVAINSMLPDYLYRGLENMRIITFRTVLLKLFFTAMIFIFLKDKTQYYYIPILNIIGAAVSVLVIYYHVIKKMEISFVKVSWQFLWITFKSASYYFYSRIATSLYDATNTFVLGFIYPTGNVLGYYTSNNSIISAVRSGFSPISDSLYPYMIKTRNYKLLKKILIIGIPIIVFGCIVVGVFAESICATLFGEEYRASGNILKLLLPLIVLAFPTYLLGFPALTPLGLAKFANLSTIIGATIHLIGLVILFLVGMLNVYNICILTCITEFLVLTIRSFVLFIRIH